MKTKHTKGEVYKPVKYDPLLPTKIIFPAFDNEQEATKYAQLVVESINVANETGLTPRQLLDQRNELLELLEIMIKDDDKTVSAKSVHSVNTIQRALAAIKKNS